MEVDCPEAAAFWDGEDIDDDDVAAMDKTVPFCSAEKSEIAFYRGGQPTAEGRAWLTENGFNTVVDLRGFDRYCEQQQHANANAHSRVTFDPL